MNNLGNARVNETHICVLRRVENEDRVKVDYVEIKPKFQDQLEELKRMADNDNRSVLDLQDYVNGSSLKRFKLDFDFCTCLSDAYQWICCLPEVTFENYQKKMEEFDKNKDSDGKERYVRDERQRYYNRIAARNLPATLEKMYYELGNDPTVLAYSHRRVGWASPDFMLNDDIKVVYLTNFGYGSASYFFLQIFYKGIGILPYSEWVHYRKASTYDIIRYTRRYHLANEEWKKTMQFTADVYNAAVSNPANFIQKNILNEVEEMVSGLETIQSTSSFKVQESFFNPGNPITISGDELTLFKGEKISGALDFLDELQTLVPITDKVGSYIQRIMNCNHSIIKELVAAIAEKKPKLEELNKRLEELDSKWEELYARENRFYRMRELLRNVLRKEPEYTDISNYEMDKILAQKFEERHPEYKIYKAEYEEINSICYQLRSKRDSLQSFVDKLKSYLDKIEDHKNYMVEKNIAA